MKPVHLRLLSWCRSAHVTFFRLGFVNENASREAGLVYVQSAAPRVETLHIRPLPGLSAMGARKGRISLACSPARSRGDNPLFPESARVRLSNGFLTPRFRDLCRTHGQTEAYRRARTHFHHPLCAAAHDRLSIRCRAGKTQGQELCPPQRSSASMSFSWLFLVGLDSTRARLRVTNRGQCAVNSVRRSRNLQPTANYL